MRRRTSPLLAAALIVVLAGSLAVQVWVLPSAADRVVAVFPEVERLVVASVVWGVLAIACWQAIALIGLRVVLTARVRRLHEIPRGWLRAVVGCLLAFLVLVVVALVALTVMEYATPGVMLGLVFGGLVALVGLAALGIHLAVQPRPALARGMAASGL
jgi:hypothetical protein